VVALAAGLMLFAGIGQASIGRSILEKAGLFEQPTSYTSLAFAQPQNLAERLTAKQETIGISFIIHNSGGRTYGYQWSIQFVQAAHTYRAAAGNVSIDPGKGATISRTEAIQCTRKQVQIVVSLAHPAESIDAWMACPSHKG
jgi:hypothetical protein